MNITSYVKTVRSVITANSPVLLLGTTITGVVTTGEPGEDAPNLTPQEIVQLTWPSFTLPTISAAGTIAAAVGTHTVHTKRANAMAALYAVTSNKLDDMTERAEELLGPKKTQQLQNDVAQKALTRRSMDEDAEVYMTNEGEELCFDEWSGRYFMGSVQGIESAINDVNRQIIDQGDACLNDFYESVGLNSIEIGETFGWSGTKIEARFAAVTSKDGRPAISVGFHKAPKAGLGF